MKQHITFEQLNELSQPARHKLREYMLKDWAKPMMLNGEVVSADIPDYRLSIGQMIEYLDSFDVPYGLYRSKLGGYGWSVDLPEHVGIDVNIPWNEELCDALWEAVKRDLEK